MIFAEGRFLISLIPDTSLTPSRLEQIVSSFIADVSGRSEWLFRERYIDRGSHDPYYTMEFHESVEERGDDLMDEELFETGVPSIRMLRFTRELTGDDWSYWRKISGEGLIDRLENFLDMYRNNYLQPPGVKGDRIKSGGIRHDRLPEHKFVYSITSPSRRIIGTGPAMFAGQGEGALAGRVYGDNSLPLAHVTVQLISREKRHERISDGQGRFWFSRVPPGHYVFRVPGHKAKVNLVKEENFGNASGWLHESDHIPVPNTPVNLIAPDNETFPAHTNRSGKFSTGPLPAFPYILRIPDHLFTLERSVEMKNGVLGGYTRSDRGAPLPGVHLVLKQGDTIVGETDSDQKGQFLFPALVGGRYQLEVPGHKFHMSPGQSDSVRGNSSKEHMVEVVLYMRDTSVYTERTARDHTYRFDPVAPYTYTNREKKPG